MLKNVNQSIQERIKNPLFWTGVSGLLWTLYLGKQGWITNEEYRFMVDIIAYIGIGTGIYTNFPKQERNEGE